MKTARVKVINPTGLHTRPGTEFVQLAKKFQSEITIRKDNKTGNAKSIIKVLKIGISCGDEIEITASGNDEESAVDSLVEYVKNLTE